MSLQTDTVGLFRNQWASRFVDEVDVLRFATPGSFNEATGVYDSQTDATILAGGGIPNALIRPGSGEEDEEQLANEQRTYSGYDVFFAFDSPPFEIEDKIVVTTSLTEPTLDGLTLVVVAVILDGYNTRRKVIAELDLGRGSGRG